MKECLNTTIEIERDHISIEYHDLSGLAKDVVASVVMLAVTVTGDRGDCDFS